jgi:hypothetical protein
MTSLRFGVTILLLAFALDDLCSYSCVQAAFRGAKPKQIPSLPDSAAGEVLCCLWTCLIILAGLV